MEDSGFCLASKGELRAMAGAGIFQCFSLLRRSQPLLRCRHLGSHGAFVSLGFLSTSRTVVPFKLPPGLKAPQQQAFYKLSEVAEKKEALVQKATALSANRHRIALERKKRSRHSQGQNSTY